MVPEFDRQNGRVIDRDEMLADLAALVNVESPSRDREAIADSAQAVADVLTLRTGLSPQFVDGDNGPHVHWRGSDEASILIVGHHDTVFPRGTLAERPFMVADGKATGPGVFDMKSGIVVAAHAVGSLDDPSGIEMLFTSDEEIGSVTSRALIEARAQACGTVLVFEPAGDGGALKIARKGMGTFRVTVRGRAAHAGLEPEKGINSLLAAAELIQHIATLGDPTHGTTVTPTMARAGTADNVIPATTEVLVDARVTVPAERERVEAAMRRLRTTVPGAEIELAGGINRPPMPASSSAPLLPYAFAAAAELGSHQLDTVSVGGGSDGNFTAALGIPTLDGLGAIGGGAHADHEFVEVDQLVPRAELVAELLRRLLARTT